MNQCHFLGRLTADPEVRTTPSGKAVTAFRIAVNRQYRRGEETVQEAAFLDMEAWDKTGEFVAAHFASGDPILVHCAVKQDDWEDKQTGQKRSKLKFRVNAAEFIPRPPDRDKAGSKPARANGRRPAREDDDAAPVGATDDDIPF